MIFGKTNVPEFTLQGYTHKLLFGTTRNPWDPKLTPGGFSNELYERLSPAEQCGASANLDEQQGANPT